MGQPKPAEKCSQCKVNPVERSGYPKWCKECHARYQREYQLLRGERGEAKGFARGVEAMRQAASAHFGRFRNAHFSGYECAKILATMPAPRYAEEAAPAAEPAAASNSE